MEKECDSILEKIKERKKNTLNFETEVKGLDFESQPTISEFIESFSTVGFQATNVFKGIEEIKKMKNTKIFLGATSNLISSGLRETIRYLIKYNHINVFVTTGGGIEEDIIKTFKPTMLADFNYKGEELRDNCYNRIGNCVIHSENYAIFERWLSKIVDEITEGYTKENPLIMTPSKFIKLLGERINNPESILYWAFKNNIPVYSPAITDGSIGDILTFHKRREVFKLDIVEDIYNINHEAMFEKETSAIILGCGIVKHHILNANIFKNGLEHCVLVNTAVEYNGSDAGASLDEAVSWGKVKPDFGGIKIHGDATIIFPLMVAGAFGFQNKN
ncbi:Deoxyhypusine synthase [Astathelohania contejeani]|uniref:deoxyhypusine synthase n=1 Tax=Astathelohania contejeani TaxID=164912 RepID=A0ABQ7HW05_9MICR|nr:Deoxyhypusine synthase [Thelohania contejeani]